MHTRSYSVLVISLLVGLVGCSGGSSLGGPTEGSGTSASSEGSCGSSTSNGSSSADGANAAGSGQVSDAPSSSTPDETPSTPSSSSSGGSSGPRPECVAFANHQCACNGSHATANCTTNLADGCEAGVKTCPGQLAWYTCVTSNACGTNACAGLGKSC